MKNNEKNINEKNINEKANLLKVILDLDAGQALVATLIIAIIGFLTSVLSKVYNMVYWMPFFNRFSIPYKFYSSADITEVNIADIAIAITLALIYYILLKKITHVSIGNVKEKKRIVFIFLSAVIFLSAAFAGLIALIITNGEVIMVFIVFVIISFFITVVTDIVYLGNMSEKDKEDIRSVSLYGIVAAICTLFLTSLGIVYLAGYFQFGIAWYDFKYIKEEGEESYQAYVQVLDLKDGYFCMPVETGPLFEGGADESVLTINTSEYKIISKEHSVIVTDTPAFAYKTEPSKMYMDYIGENERLYFAIIILVIIVGLGLVAAEIRWL